MYKGSLQINMGASLLIVYPGAITVLIEVGRAKGYNSLWHLIICFLLLSLSFSATLYQLITSRLSIFHPDAEALSLVSSFYLHMLPGFGCGIIMLLLHIIKGRNRGIK
jgi:hypothetical protein